MLNLCDIGCGDLPSAENQAVYTLVKIEFVYAASGM